jgi:hypothetical protein
VQGVLTREWKDASGKSMWDSTFHAVRDISPTLTPDVLANPAAT